MTQMRTTTANVPTARKGSGRARRGANGLLRLLNAIAIGSAVVLIAIVWLLLAAIAAVGRRFRKLLGR